MFPIGVLLTAMVMAGGPSARAEAAPLGDPAPEAARALAGLFAGGREDAALSGADLSAVDSVRRRFDCVAVSGTRAETLASLDGVADVLVTLAGSAQSRVTRAPQELPPHWMVRLRLSGERWRVESVSIPEADVAASIAASNDVAIPAGCERFVTPELARRLCEIGDALDAASDSKHAADLAELARHIALETGDRTEEARALWLLAKSQDTRDQIGPSRKTYEAAYQAATAAGDADLIAATLTGMITARIRNGDLGGGPELETAYRLALQAGNDRVASAAILRLGVLDEYGGKYADALKKYEEAARRAEAAGDLVAQARAVTETGVTYDYMNNAALAYDFMRRGIAMYRRAHNIAGVIRSLRNFADMEAADQHLKEAEDHLSEVERLLETAPNLRTSAYVAATRASIASARHDTAGAERACLRALELGKKLGLDLVVTVMTHELAQTRFRQKRYREAAALARETIERERTITPDFDTYWHAQQTLGRALDALGQRVEARAAFVEAIAAIERSSANVPGAGTDQQLFFGDKAEPYYWLFGTFAHENPMEGVLWAERARGRTLLDIVAHGHRKSTRSLTEAEQREETALEQRITESNVSLRDERARHTPDPARIAATERSLAELRNERAVLTRRLYENHPELALARGDIPLPTAAGIRRAIPSDGAVVEYLAMNEQTWVVVLTRTGPPRLHLIPMGWQPLQQMIKSFVDQVDSRDLHLRSSSRKLYDLLLAPISPALRGKKMVCIIADSGLWNLPFQALMDHEDRYFVETHAVFYAPSLAFLAWQKQHQRRAPRDTRLLGYGNPEIAPATADKARAYRRDESLGALPEAEEEVRALASIYGRARTTLRIGAAATETDFKKSAGHYRIVHLATHAMFDDTDPMYSHLVLSRTAGDPNDGLLEAREVVNLSLDIDLAVLSACETGRSEARGGEGMIGLTWALLAAGCRTEVLTQMKIGSASTRDLMVDFHRSLAGRGRSATGRPVTLALRDSQLKMLRSAARWHPFYWAPFIVVGEGW